MEDSQKFVITELTAKAKNLIISITHNDENTFTEEANDHFKNIVKILNDIKMQGRADQQSLQKVEIEHEKLKDRYAAAKRE